MPLDHRHERDDLDDRARSGSVSPGAESHDGGVLDLQQRAGNRAVTAALGAHAPLSRAVHREALPTTSTEEEEEAGAAAVVSRTIARASEGVDAVAGPLDGEVASRIDRARMGGGGLDQSLRQEMESGFGTSFEDVRIHTDAESDDLNRALQAKAFTTGSDIFFRDDAPSPTTSAGKQLLAHELAHVVQQRSERTAGPMTVGRSDDASEAAADRAAEAALHSGEGHRVEEGGS